MESNHESMYLIMTQATMVSQVILLMYCTLKNIHKKQNMVFAKESYRVVNSNRILIVVTNSEQ